MSSNGLGVLLVALASHLALCHETPCNLGNQIRCLEGVKDYLTRTNWWFGNESSSESCDNVKDFECLNPRPDLTTLLARITQRADYDVEKITQTLRIRYHVPAGSYLACGHIFDVPELSMVSDIDHTHVQHTDSWTLDHRPTITWEAGPGDVYNLIAVNVDYLQLAGWWVNIAGGDSSLGSEIYPHKGPQAAFVDRLTFQAFVLNKVEGKNQSANQEEAKMSADQVIGGSGHGINPAHISINDPIAVGLIGVRGDAYGIEAARSAQLVNNCPQLIALKQPVLQVIDSVHQLAQMGVDLSQPEVQVEVTYWSEEISYSACCVNRTEEAMKVKVNPYSAQPIMPVVLRSTPWVRLSPVNMQDPNFYLDKLFTVLLLDVTRAILDPADRSKVTLLLWHISDIAGPYVTSGRTNMAYTQPLPPPASLAQDSVYLFLVFQQNGTLQDFELSDYCAEEMYGGCVFNLSKFVMGFDLHFCGLNLFRSKADLYSRMVMIEHYGQKAAQACEGVPGYGTPCAPRKCAPPTTETPASNTTPNGASAAIITPLILFLMIGLDYVMKAQMT